MADYLESVKALATQFRTWATSADEDGKASVAAANRARANLLETLASEVEVSRRRLQPIPTSYGDLSDLPQAVLDELNLTKVDELEQQLRDIVASADGGEIGLDAIIIELYRRHRIIEQRRFIMNKLYRMAQKGLIYSVEGRKGVYYLPKPSTPMAFDADLDDDVPF